MARWDEPWLEQPTEEERAEFKSSDDDASRRVEEPKDERLRDWALDRLTASPQES